MNYRAINGRVAVNLCDLALPIGEELAKSVLLKAGFRQESVSLSEVASALIGVPRYCRNADPTDAPGVVDCSSFVMHLYAQLGVELPRLPIQQRDIGRRVNFKDALPGDLMFCVGRTRNYFHHDSSDQLGHVGLYVGGGKVIHLSLIHI